jgi:hypothetical protein
VVVGGNVPSTDFGGSPSTPGSNPGRANSGAGGAAGNSDGSPGGTGGSGVVIIRYQYK